VLLSFALLNDWKTSASNRDDGDLPYFEIGFEDQWIARRRLIPKYGTRISRALTKRVLSIHR
jgi:hypothetical protein